ncbi:MAG: ester cyclase [Pyrinomonadaceae bacterium]|nr:ester cyclase [Pyrinomonadaceae bacterium]
MEEENKKIVLEYVEAFNKLDIDVLRKLFAEDAIVYGVLGSGGMDVAVEIWKELHAAFGFNLQVDSMIAEGDIVAVRYTERGKSVGSFRGSPVTGKSFETVAMEWFIIKDGRIQSRWGARDSATQARQMGIPLS